MSASAAPHQDRAEHAADAGFILKLQSGTPLSTINDPTHTATAAATAAAVATAAAATASTRAGLSTPIAALAASAAPALPLLHQLPQRRSWLWVEMQTQERQTDFAACARSEASPLPPPPRQAPARTAADTAAPTATTTAAAATTTAAPAAATEADVMSHPCVVPHRPQRVRRVHRPLLHRPRHRRCWRPHERMHSNNNSNNSSNSSNSSYQSSKG